MSRINYAAKHEYESMANYKILQTVFQRNRIDKPIPVDRLVRCKMQDNLEFLQWLKKFWDTNYAGDGYDADARRAAAPSRAGSAASMAGRRQSMGARAGTASRQSTVSRQGTVPPVPRHSTARVRVWRRALVLRRARVWPGVRVRRARRPLRTPRHGACRWRAVVRRDAVHRLRRSPTRRSTSSLRRLTR